MPLVRPRAPLGRHGASRERRPRSRERAARRRARGRPDFGADGSVRHADARRPGHRAGRGERRAGRAAGALSNRHRQRFLDAVGRHELLERDPDLATIEGRTRRIDELCGLVERELGQRDTASAVALLESIDAPVMTMRSVDELLSDPHLLATGFFGEEQHPGEGRLRTVGTGATWHEHPLPTPGPAPRLGQHTREVLAGWGTLATRSRRPRRRGGRDRQEGAVDDPGRAQRGPRACKRPKTGAMRR